MKNAIIKNNKLYIPAQPEKIFRKLKKKDLAGFPLKEKALHLATQAHDGQYRKSEPTVPYIVHPIEVASILIEEGFGGDNGLIMAALLHDVVEDTPYTLKELRDIFGDDVARLISCATENKSLSWEDRKLEKIGTVRGLLPREKRVIIADEIANLSSLKKEFDVLGRRDFSLYSRGEEQQKWKFRGMMESLMFNNGDSRSLLERLERSYNNIFSDDAKFGFMKGRDIRHYE